jgi:hypothetical protein
MQWTYFFSHRLLSNFLKNLEQKVMYFKNTTKDLLVALLYR